MTMQSIVNRIVIEVERICQKSDRIQNSGNIQGWQISLGKHRIKRCLFYYQLGSQRGRIELHSNLSAIVYSYISLPKANLGFEAKCNLIEDFLQDFYLESIRAFRRENNLDDTYTPNDRLTLAEYMSFSEQYAKRNINIGYGKTQQLIILRAHNFAKKQPQDTLIDFQQLSEFNSFPEGENHQEYTALKTVRSQLTLDQNHINSQLLREQIIQELINYLQTQEQNDCIDYLTLKLQDFTPSEIDDILGLKARQRDYLQQKLKYHVEKFAFDIQWELVHQWLLSDLDHRLGMTHGEWEKFTQQISPEQQKILELKKLKTPDEDIIKNLKITAKKMRKKWTELLIIAWEIRNN
jgi:hypothetical protein